jgi:hypothetical protein
MTTVVMDYNFASNERLPERIATIDFCEWRNSIAADRTDHQGTRTPRRQPASGKLSLSP